MRFIKENLGKRKQGRTRAVLPVRVRGGKLEIVQKLPINSFSRDKIDKSVVELKEEKADVSDLLK